VDYNIQLVKEVRRTLDYLETRNDIDVSRLAYYGFSWGGHLGSIVLALEKRFELGVLLDGGLPPRMRRPESNGSNFAPHVNVPVLMINGIDDSIFPVETSQKRLLDLLGTAEQHKRYVQFECGHSTISFFRNQVIREILNWLDIYFERPR